LPNSSLQRTRHTAAAPLNLAVCAEHVAQLGGESPLPSWMEAKG
jgi:hypothetical protein